MKIIATIFPGRKSIVTRYGYNFLTGRKLPENIKSLKKKRGDTQFVEVKSFTKKVK